MKLSIAAIRRSGFAVFACIALALLSTQVHAQTCTGTPTVTFDPVSQTVPKSIPGAPTIVQLKGNTNKIGPTYSWRQIPVPPATSPTPAVTLSSTTIANPTFVAPNTGPTVLRFELTARCSTGNPRSETTDINVTDVVTNSPPTALASVSPAAASEGQQVTLDGTASYDLDAGTTLTYSWVQTGVGPSSPSVTLSNANVAGSIVTFVAPNTPINTGAVLTFRLTVSDGTLTGTTDKSVNIVWTNDPPVASLVCPGGVFIVAEGGPVTLDGRGSRDNDGSIVSYGWSQDVGLPNLGVAALSTPSISFNAPILGYNQFGGVTVKLTVTDNIGATGDVRCSVWINDVTRPIIDVPNDKTVEADFAGGKAFSYSVTAFDAVDNQEPYPLACTPLSGSNFPLAAAPTKQNTTTVHCSATDAANNTTNASFNVTVQDTTPPMMTFPGSYAIQATGPNGAVATYAHLVTSLDAVDGARPVSCTPASGGTFPIQTTNVTCNAGDTRGNAAAPAGFALTVHDTVAPAISAPANRTFEATAPLTPLGTSDYGTATATDAVGVRPITSNAPAAFPLGDTVITWTATDTSGNTATATTTITVADRIAPAISAPANRTFEATAPLTLLSTFDYGTATATDAVGVGPIASDAPALFPVGDTVITWTATDTTGNIATATTTITLVDTTPPAVTPPANVTAEATGTTTTVAYGTATAYDAVGGVSLTHNAPATFPVGTTTITWTATDLAGNSGTAISTVTVVDTTAPVVTAPASVTREATAPLTTVGYGNATAYDAVGVVSLTNDAPATFPVGTTTITWTATDLAGNSGTAISTVTVVDTTAPVIDPHGNEVREASGPGGAMVNYGVVGTFDMVDRTLVASCVRASGSAFALGPHTVKCNARDAAGNDAAETSFTVTVRDTVEPVIDAHADVGPVEATGPSGAVVNYGSVNTYDVVDIDLIATCLRASGSTFALGPHTVNCNAIDASDNAAAATSFSVSVRDTTKPVIAQVATISVLATGNSQATVLFPQVNASDLVGVTSLTCSDPTGRTLLGGQNYAFAAGNTVVTCTALDNAGNSGVMNFTVRVTYNWNGFFQPIDNTLINTAKAGSAIPVKFSLGGNQGLDIFASGFPASGAMLCTSTTADEIEVTFTAGNSSLSYDAGADQYIYVWKTEKSWLGCRQLRLTLRDGTTKTAMFRFR